MLDRLQGKKKEAIIDQACRIPSMMTEQPNEPAPEQHTANEQRTQAAVALESPLPVQQYDGDDPSADEKEESPVAVVERPQQHDPPPKPEKSATPT